MIAREIKNFIKVCKMGQKELKKYLSHWLKSNGYQPIVEDGYIYAEGTDKVCVTAHMDTVHEKPRGKVKDVLITADGNKTVISSKQGIGGDDRCGIYMIQQLVEKAKLKPTIVFCEDEEIGGIGSYKFCKNEDLMDTLSQNVKFFIELDRAHDNDLVYYDDDNQKFHDWCAKVTGYKEAFGSFSDISNICPETEVSGVNISCGYYNPHTVDEYVIFEEMVASIKAAEKLIKAAQSDEVEQFIYEECRSLSYDKYGYGYGYGRTGYSMDKTYVVMFYEADFSENIDYIDACSSDEAIGIWAQDHPDLPYNYVIEVSTMSAYEDYWYEKSLKANMGKKKQA